MTDYNALGDIVKAAPDLTTEDQFTLWVESFEIPDESGTCEVEVERDTTFDDYDFFVWYLVGDCTDECIDVKFKKSNSWWENFAVEYTGDKTDRFLADHKGQRQFHLTTEDTKDRVAFAVEKRRARSFKPKSPRGIEEITILP